MNSSYSSSDGGDRYLHPHIIREHIVNKLDGPTLLSASCVSSELRKVCLEESLWKNICDSYWPKTTGINLLFSPLTFSHRSFFLDSYPTLWKLNKSQTVIKFPKKIISMVDVYYGDEVIYSNLAITKPLSDDVDGYMKNPLRFVSPKRNGNFPIPVEFDDVACTTKVEENVRLSWVVMNIPKLRAVNLSSLTPVEVIRRYRQSEPGGGDDDDDVVKARFGSVISVTGAGAGAGKELVYCAVDMICGKDELGGNLYVKDVSMHWEDVDGKILNGEESLGILKDAMEGKRVIRRKGEAKNMHEMFLKMRENKKK